MPWQEGIDPLVNMDDLVEEQGVIVSLQGDMASIAPMAQAGCQSCASNGVCGTSLLSTVIGRKQRLLVARNIINAKPGDQVTIGLNRTALVFASLVVYMLPLIMLVIGAVSGQALANATGIEDTELVSILSGVGAAALTFLVTRRVIRSVPFSTFFEPVLLEVNMNRQ